MQISPAGDEDGNGNAQLCMLGKCIHLRTVIDMRFKLQSGCGWGMVVLCTTRNSHLDIMVYDPRKNDVVLLISSS